MAEFYLILTDPAAGYLRCARAAIDAGVRWLQLRMKHQAQHEVLAMARALRGLTRGTSTRLIINDDLDVAMACDADGVHLGQSDISLEEARARWQAPGKLFGYSTHTERQQALALQQRPDYIGIGPVFPTPTKKIADPDLGVARLHRMVKTTAGLPQVAIGGIDLHNLPSVLACRPAMVCAVRPIMRSLQPESTIRHWMDRCANGPDSTTQKAKAPGSGIVTPLLQASRSSTPAVPLCTRRAYRSGRGID